MLKIEVRDKQVFKYIKVYKRGNFELLLCLCLVAHGECVCSWGVWSTESSVCYGVWQQQEGKTCGISLSHTAGAAASHWRICSVLSQCRTGWEMFPNKDDSTAIALLSHPCHYLYKSLGVGGGGSRGYLRTELGLSNQSVQPFPVCLDQTVSGPTFTV